jgi:hypothetical protein
VKPFILIAHAATATGSVVEKITGHKPEAAEFVEKHRAALR